MHEDHVERVAGGVVQIAGVIDWSDAAICDRAYDFGLLLRDLGPTALDAALGCYGIDTDVATLTQRAWFYARCAAIEDLAYGLETGHHEYTTKSLDALPWLFSRGADRN
jgi:aminoglycoside phosphotransferase (APT) family kinase protein